MYERALGIVYQYLPFSGLIGAPSGDYMVYSRHLNNVLKYMVHNSGCETFHFNHPGLVVYFVLLADALRKDLGLRCFVLERDKHWVHSKVPMS